MTLRGELFAGMEELGIEFDSEQTERLLNYLELLSKWNKVYNLTSINRQDEMMRYHLLDSLVVLPHLWPRRWLDVGCGAGLPGLVLAIMRPQWEFTLLDSNSKKTGFVQQAAIELGLSNVSVCCARVQDFKNVELYDGVISRAFADLGRFLAFTAHLIAEKGRWAAMKGRLEGELEALSAEYRVEETIQLRVPGIEAMRSLVVVKQWSETK